MFYIYNTYPLLVQDIARELLAMFSSNTLLPANSNNMFFLHNIYMHFPPCLHDIMKLLIYYILVVSCFILHMYDA